ncbi:hypothetical protein F4560_005725 [Saccharothrix ecbatanensis]|uniref:Uncharacterized protein n=1 Tax=Saccharothrix ecbatanensis TaxID=1105145 RepID=A0A7W9HPA7_9PSEU|nr:hypothetical protein [Saccharothrix ecbatanensis]
MDKPATSTALEVNTADRELGYYTGGRPIRPG